MRTWLSVVLWIGLVGSACANAAEVAIAISSPQTYVGKSVTLQIAVDGNLKSEPEIPDVDGLLIEPAGQSSSRRQMIGSDGRVRLHNSLVLQYSVTPQREGEFVIPPIKIHTEGSRTITKAVRLGATKSETGDLMYVAIRGGKDRVFVGQSVDLTLQIWVRPYQNEDYGVELSEGQTWGLISRRTRWGQFGDVLQDLAKQRRRPGHGREVYRKDADGLDRKYWLYEISATVYPTHTGRIDADDIRIEMDYPTKIGRQRDPFEDFFGDSGSPLGGSMFGGMIPTDSLFRSRSGLAVTETRPIAAEAVVDPIDVVAIPQDGRPASYRGAVGRYTIDVEASPRDANVGDPITLTINVRGTGPLDLVRAPDLASQSQLVDGFKVADDDLAGYVDGNQKTFQTTIRARREGPQQIPPIEFSYFDPDAEKFVTVASDPISVDIQPGDLLKLDSIVADRKAAPIADATEPFRWDSFAGTTVSDRGFSADELMFQRGNHQPLGMRSMLWLGLAPMLWVLAWGFASRRWLFGWRSSKRRFHQAIDSAQTANEVAAALAVYLAGRLKLDGDHGLDDRVVGTLRRDGQSELAIRTERVMSMGRSEGAVIADPTGDAGLQSMKDEARKIAAAVSTKTGSRPLRTGQLRTTAVLGVVFAGSHLFSSAAAAQDQSSLLSDQQQIAIAREAVDLYQQAIQDPGTSDSMQQFELAAERYKSLAEGGLVNDRLYFNWGLAAQKSGRVGEAIAAYRKALRINPENVRYHDHLAQAESDAGVDHNPTVSAWFAWANDRLLRVVRPAAMRVIGLVGWWVCWVALAASVLIRTPVRRACRIVAVIAVLVAAPAAVSYWSRVLPLARDGSAVIVHSPLQIHEGDGKEFPVQDELIDRNGELVRVVEQRKGWVKIRRRQGSEGWVPDSQLTVI
ncbi:Tetratricopeptide repeat protein [Rubripirellula lacrimiformis]|uniref:Tetratricopeptide repeat protein n=1 Tax=Rubripirellula lacrimiformis TaxID=1930273 RepID=A0A517NAE2_9BACT|nr:BatD family protein [Rubripirellula lacrimiformis]QDT04103.1 Tetratricopeptide repeat protein [Rubripirellula lacrimiformis]